MKERSDRISFSIRSEIGQVAMIGISIYNILLQKGLSPKLSNRIEVAAVEAITNSIRHAYQNNPEFEVETILTCSAQQVEVTIIDRGIPVNPSFINPTLNYDIEDISTLSEGGMGLYLIYKIMDQVEFIHDGKKNIWTLTKHINKEQP